MPDHATATAKVAVFVSGTGTNMAALLYASRLPGSPYEIALVAANDPAAPALALRYHDRHEQGNTNGADREAQLSDRGSGLLHGELHELGGDLLAPRIALAQQRRFLSRVQLRPRQRYLLPRDELCLCSALLDEGSRRPACSAALAIAGPGTEVATSEVGDLD